MQGLMKIGIKNIGAIKDVTAECNGLTVITGKNGSGKSTFAKAYSAIIDGFRNSTDFFDRNFVVYVQNAIIKALKVKSLSELRYLDRDLYLSLKRSPRTIKDIFKYISEIKGRLQDFFLEQDKLVNDASNGNASLRGRTDNIQKCLVLLDSLRAEYTSDDYRDKHLKRCIRDELNAVFLGQVAPLERTNSGSTIAIESRGFGFEYDYSADEMWVTDLSSHFPNRAYYIENASVLDRLDDERGGIRNLTPRDEFVTARLDDYLFDDFLRRDSGLFGLRAEEQYKDILDLISQAYPYDIVRMNTQVITSNAGVRISNEASGRKIFALLKQMVLSGRLDDSTVILFDEPENHLHPEWQLLFAKVMKKIVEQTGAKVFCITHSPTLLFAFDTFFRANRDLLRVYYCHREDNGCFFEDVSADISKAHKVLSHPFIQLDLLGEGAI
jgi:predicted ATP-dependent endonuclease of OLD family